MEAQQKQQPACFFFDREIKKKRDLFVELHRQFRFHKLSARLTMEPFLQSQLEANGGGFEGCVQKSIRIQIQFVMVEKLQKSPTPVIVCNALTRSFATQRLIS